MLIKTPKRGKTINYVAVNSEPLGLLYIASFLQKFGPEHAVTVLDAQSEDPRTRPIDNSYLRMGMSDEAIRARIMIEKPDVIGISALFEVQESEIINVASIAKSVDPNIRVVWWT